MAVRRSFTSSAFLIFLFGCALFVVHKTVGFCIGLQYKTHIPIKYVSSEDNYGVKLEFKQFSINNYGLQNHVEWVQSWTYFVTLGNLKEDVLFDYYRNRASLQTSCMFWDRNRCFGQEKQVSLIESEFELEVLFSQAERVQICVFLQLDICTQYRHIIKYKRMNCSKRLNRRIQCYSNSVASFQLLIACGDIQTNPGPSTNDLSSTNKQENRHNNNLINIACSHGKQRDGFYDNLELFKPLRFCL